jgi:hypothetical protein
MRRNPLPVLTGTTIAERKEHKEARMHGRGFRVPAWARDLITMKNMKAMKDKTRTG